MDATRTADGKFVFLKAVKKSVHPFEADIGLFFSSDSMSSDPRNHCVPIYQTLQLPDDKDTIILVMPLLKQFYFPWFDTVGEVVEFFRQVFEVRKRSLHESIESFTLSPPHIPGSAIHAPAPHCPSVSLTRIPFYSIDLVAEPNPRDVMHLNIMMDATHLYSKPYHPAEPFRFRDFSLDGWFPVFYAPFPGPPKHYTRTQRPVKYYFTDFGVSRRYNPDDGPPLEPPILGGDKTVPEFQESLESCDPFPTDVYYLGHTIRKTFLVVSHSSTSKSSAHRLIMLSGYF
jgi:hypothetical protein